MSNLLDWLQSLKGGAPTVVGTIVGSTIGFATIVLGALFNARLNRLRDDNLRSIEIQAIAAALLGELAGIEQSLIENANKLTDEPPEPNEDFNAPDPSHAVRMFPQLVGKVGLFGSASMITELVGTYVVIDQYCETLLMYGGRLAKGMPDHRRIISMRHDRAPFVAHINRSLAERISSVRKALSEFL